MKGNFNRFSFIFLASKTHPIVKKKDGVCLMEYLYDAIISIGLVIAIGYISIKLDALRNNKTNR